MQQRFPFQRQRRQALELAIIHAVPALNRFRPASGWPHPLSALACFPPHSWGAQLAHFLAARGFPTFLANYEAHDALHVLLDYETDLEGELRLQAFLDGNQSASFAGTVLLWLGIVVYPELIPQLRAERQRGQTSASLRTWDIAARLADPLADVRSALALPTPG
jgi:hypothetical protein